jgi:hypothetical protein
MLSLCANSQRELSQEQKHGPRSQRPDGLLYALVAKLSASPPRSASIDPPVTLPFEECPLVGCAAQRGALPWAVSGQLLDGILTAAVAPVRFGSVRNSDAFYGCNTHSTHGPSCLTKSSNRLVIQRKHAGEPLCWNTSSAL